MRIATEASFVLPTGRALWVPAAEPYAAAILGQVAMHALCLQEDVVRANAAG